MPEIDLTICSQCEEKLTEDHETSGIGEVWCRRCWDSYESPIGQDIKCLVGCEVRVQVRAKEMDTVPGVLHKNEDEDGWFLDDIPYGYLEFDEVDIVSVNVPEALIVLDL